MTFELGLFEQGVQDVKAVCEFVHVFVERATGRTAKGGMPGEVREGLEKLLRNGEGRGGSKL